MRYLTILEKLTNYILFDYPNDRGIKNACKSYPSHDLSGKRDEESLSFLKVLGGKNKCKELLRTYIPNFIITNLRQHKYGDKVGSQSMSGLALINGLNSDQVSEVARCLDQ